MMRRLGRRWQMLHRLVYPVTLLGVWHYYWQVKADIREPPLDAAALALLLGGDCGVGARAGGRSGENPTRERAANRD
jgi:DMSO/TMAO reductase YedYZ heme-binding membrane subunit